MNRYRLIPFVLCFYVYHPYVLAAPIDEGDSSAIDELFGEDVEGKASDPATRPSELPSGLREIQEARKALSDGDIQHCRDKLRAAYAQSPNLPPPKLMLARLVLAAGQVRYGRQLLEEVALSHPNHPELYLLFGRLALSDGHATDAALHFERALSLDEPTNWNDGQRAYLNRACLQGQTSVAERRGDWAQAAKLYQEQIDARPKNAQLRDRFAMVLFRSGELDRAFEQFDLSQLQDATMNPPEISMAVMFVREGDYDKADTWFAKALEKHAKQPEVHFEHSIAMLYQDRTKEAAASAAKAVELGMKSKLLDMHLGLIALQSGDSPAAEKHFEEVLQKSPDNAGAMTKLALLLVERSDEAEHKRALELAEKAGKAFPNSPEVAAVLGWTYYRTGRRSDGENLLRAAAAQPNTDPLPLFLYARMLVSEQKTEEARKVATLIENQIEGPGLFVFRPAVKKWLARVMPEGG